MRFNEWNDIYRQIIEVVHKFKWKLNSTSATSCTDLKPNSKNVYGSSSLGVSYENSIKH